MSAGENITDFEQLSKMIAPIARKYGISRVYLFGSRARGDNRSDSDYDFCILPGKETTFFGMGGFLVESEELLGREVDVVSERNLSPKFFETISRERRLLYEA